MMLHKWLTKTCIFLCVLFIFAWLWFSISDTNVLPIKLKKIIHVHVIWPSKDMKIDILSLTSLRQKKKKSNPPFLTADVVLSSQSQIHLVVSNILPDNFCSCNYPERRTNGLYFCIECFKLIICFYTCSSPLFWQKNNFIMHFYILVF